MCANAISHHQFIELLMRLEDSDFNDVVYFANTRQLSHARVLRRFNATPRSSWRKRMLVKYLIIKTKNGRMIYILHQYHTTCEQAKFEGSKSLFVSTVYNGPLQTFFSNLHGTFTKMDHVLGHISHLKKL